MKIIAFIERRQSEVIEKILRHNSPIRSGMLPPHEKANSYWSTKHRENHI